MKKMRIPIAILTFIFLSGCNGTIHTVMDPELISTKNGKTIPTDIEGAIAYQIVNVIELYENKSLVDEASGNVLGEAPTKCIAQRFTKFSTRADYNKPYIIKYVPGFLDTYKFSFTLKDGVLASVNTESDPSKTIAAMAALLSSATKAAALTFTPGGKPFCNANPKFIGLYKAPDIEPFSQMK